MKKELAASVAHVIWIGGATDAGKSTIARKLAKRHNFQVYSYDQFDVPHHKQLAKTSPIHRQLFTASLDDRWIATTPEELLQRSLTSFRDRFALVIDDLLALAADKTIVAEGFGLLPELLSPLLSSNYQGIWLHPSKEFKIDSMTRRGKPGFAAKTSDPEKARMNLFRRDMLIAELYRKQTQKYGYKLLTVDGSLSAEKMTDLVEAHFNHYLDSAAHKR